MKKFDFLFDWADPRWMGGEISSQTLRDAVEDLAGLGLSPRGKWYPTPFFNAVREDYHGGFKWSLWFAPVGIYQYDEDNPVGGTLRVACKKKPKFDADVMRTWAKAKRDPATQPSPFVHSYSVFFGKSTEWIKRFENWHTESIKG